MFFWQLLDDVTQVPLTCVIVSTGMYCSCPGQAIIWPLVYQEFFLRWPVTESSANPTPGDNVTEDGGSEHVADSGEQTNVETLQKVI